MLLASEGIPNDSLTLALADQDGKAMAAAKEVIVRGVAALGHREALGGDAVGFSV